MNHKVRIGLEDPAIIAILKLSDGNPGASVALGKCFELGATIDPDAAFGGMSSILGLDNCGIYGSDIWVLYKNISNRDVVTMIGLLRAVQLGLLHQKDLLAAIKETRMDQDQVASLIAKVKEQLPAFGIATPDQG